MRYQEAISAFRAQKASKFVLAGAESFLKEQFVSFVRSTMDTSVYRVDESREALTQLSADGLFQGVRAIVLLGFEKMSPDKFVKALDGTSNVVVLSLGEKADLKSRAMTEILSFSVGVTCDKLKEYNADYPNWIASVFSEAGYTVESDVAKTVYLRVGSDMSTISREIDKLLLVCSDTKNIRTADVERFVSVTARATSFEILDALLRKDIAGALKKHTTYLDGSLELSQFLGMYFEKILRMVLLREQGFSVDEVADIIGLPRFVVKTRYMSQAMALGKGNILNKIDMLCEIDAKVRTFKGDKRVILDRFIYSFF